MLSNWFARRRVGGTRPWPAALLVLVGVCSVADADGRRLFRRSPQCYPCPQYYYCPCPCPPAAGQSGTFTPGTAGWPAAVTRKLHAVILVADQHTGVGEMAQVDDGLVRILLGDQIDPARLAPPVVLRESKGELTAERVLAAIDALPVEPTDAVLCFFTGAGSYDAAGKPYLRLAGGEPLERAAVSARLKAKGARLTALLTDTCGAVLNQPVEEVPLQLPPDAAEPITLFWLLLRHQGVVDVDSHSPGERPLGQAVSAAVSTGVGETGGSLFAVQLFKECKLGESATEANVTWAAFLERLTKNVGVAAATAGESESSGRKQTPKVHELTAVPDRDPSAAGR
jgi:hypothetical protein